MISYILTIVMQDGSSGRCSGLFANDWDAITSMLDAFGDARRITARRVVA